MVFSDDLFDHTFDVLQASIASGGLGSLEEEHGGVSDDGSSVAAILRVNAVDGHSARIDERLKALRRQRASSRGLYQQEVVHNRTVVTAVKDIWGTSSKKVTLQGQAAQRQLKEQKYNSERRMRELLYEIIGEYGKSLARMERRGAYLWHANQIQLNWVIWQQRWRRFILKLSFDLSAAHAAGGIRGDRLAGQVLCGCADRAEVASVLNTLERLGLHEGGKSSDCNVVRLVNATRDIKHLSASDGGEFVKPIVMERRSEFGAMVTELRVWLAREGKGRHSMLPTASGANIPHPPPRSSRAGGGRGDASRLTEVLSSAGLLWLQPAAARPDLWSEHADGTDAGRPMCSPRASMEGGGAAGDAEVSEEQRQLDAFTTRFAMQHTAFVTSQRLYFCLEERCAVLAHRAPFPTPRSDGKDDAALSALTVIDALQQMYCPNVARRSKTSAKGGAFMTSTGTEMDDDGGTSLTADVLDTELAKGPMILISSTSAHRGAGKSAVLVDFPDVLRGRLATGRVCHFVPAMVLNLVETRAFCGLPYSAEDLRRVRQHCPHPHLPYLASSKHPLLAHLYCLGSALPVRNSGDETNSQLLVPLSRVCMNELLSSSLWPVAAGDDPTLRRPMSAAGNPNGGGDGVLPIPPPGELFVRGGPAITHPSECAAFLLPDHSRDSITAGPPSDLTMLRHKYVLIRSKFSGSGQIHAATTATNRGSGGATDRIRKSPQVKRRSEVAEEDQPVSKTPCYYLVQLKARKSPSQVAWQNNDDDSAAAQRHAADEEVFTSVLAAHHQGLHQVGPSSAEEAEVSSKKWDTAVLSNVCRWRACLCDATAEPAPKYLCAYHTVVKNYLDGKSSSAKTSEASKYLPRKTPPSIPLNDPNRDAQMVRAASTLLQELWDGKMKGTLRSFANKVCEELNQRRRLGMIVAREREREKAQTKRRGGAPPPQGALPFARMDLGLPRWAKWKDKAALTRFTGEVESLHTTMMGLLSAERGIGLQLSALRQMGVYPGTELAIVRKDMKALKEAQEVADEERGGSAAAGSWDEMADMNRMQQAELRLTEKKLELLQRRCQEESEAHALQLRKMQRVKATEAQQSRDPSNFGYSAAK
jgi:hypothetical protein